MNKEFIPYEQALSLKELGFDENCLSYYISECYYNSKKEKKYRKGILYHGHFNKKSLSDFDDNKTIQVIAPLYQQAFRFFREKYGLEIILAPDSLNDISKKLREYKIISYDKSWKIEEILEPSHWIRKGCFSTYEEAELECLKKLIEIVKNK